MGRRAFATFARSCFSFDARIFWLNGYQAVDGIKDMDHMVGEIYSYLRCRETRTAAATGYLISG